MGELADIKKTLQQLKPELSHKYHIHSIGLFGSIIRGDSSTDSVILISLSNLINLSELNLLLLRTI